MKKFALRAVLTGACLFTGGCATVANTLHEVAWQLEQERLHQEHQAWLQAMYGPLPSNDIYLPGVN